MFRNILTFSVCVLLFPGLMTFSELPVNGQDTETVIESDDAAELDALQEELEELKKAKQKLLKKKKTRNSLKKSRSQPKGMEATHKQVYTLAMLYRGKPTTLNTFCLDRSGNIYASCGGIAGDIVLSEEEIEKAEGTLDDVTTSSKAEANVLLVFDPERKLKDQIPLPFKVTALNFSKDGSLVIGGQGQMAKMTTDGKILKLADTPQIDDSENYREKLLESLKQEQVEMAESFSENVKSFEQQLEGLEQIKEEDRTRGETRMIKALTQQISFYKDQIESQKTGAVDNEYLNMMLEYKLRVPSLAVTDQDVFITVSSLEGYGYEVWRVDHQLENPKMIISDLSGCCGQLDIQTDGENIFVAENGKFRVSSFDREGEEITNFGKADRSSVNGFGSCCNPMNIRCCSNGDIITAESSIGNLKRFSKAGELLANIGKAKVTGGCKHVAVGYDESRNRFYLMNTATNSINVLLSRTEAPEFTQDEMNEKKAREGLGRKLIGTWERLDKKKSEEIALEQSDEDSDVFIVSDYSSFPGLPSDKISFTKEGLYYSADSSSNSGSLLDAVSNLFATQPPMTWKPTLQKKNVLYVNEQMDGVDYLKFEIQFDDDNQISIHTYMESQLIDKAKYKRQKKQK